MQGACRRIGASVLQNYLRNSINHGGRCLSSTLIYSPQRHVTDIIGRRTLVSSVIRFGEARPEEDVPSPENENTPTPVSDGGHSLFMRGLPFTANESDIRQFFSPLSPTTIQLIYTRRGGPSGIAKVSFSSSEDVSQAKEKHNQKIESRYIELFENELLLGRQRSLLPEASISPRDPSSLPGFTEHCAFIRGLPFIASEADIRQFFAPQSPTLVDFILAYRGPSGSARVYFSSDEDLKAALAKNKATIGERYIEVSVHDVSRERKRPSVGPPTATLEGARAGEDLPPRSVQSQETRGSDSLAPGSLSRHYIFMRGLPFSASEADIRQFFSPLSPAAVNIVCDYSGRPSGNAKVYFSSDEDVKGAMDKSMNTMNNRYIELFERDSLLDRDGTFLESPRTDPETRTGKNTFSRRENRSSGANSSHVFLRGLPFRANENDIRQFFSPLYPTSVKILLDNSGRHTGTAEVYFSSDADTNEALRKHKNRMEHRYIEVFSRDSNRRNDYF